MLNDKAATDEAKTKQFVHLLDTVRLDNRLYSSSHCETIRGFSLGMTVGFAIQDKSRGLIEPWQLRYISNLAQRFLRGESA